MKAIKCLIQEKYKLHTTLYTPYINDINEKYEKLLTLEENSNEYNDTKKYIEMCEKKMKKPQEVFNKTDDQIDPLILHLKKYNTHINHSFKGEIGCIPENGYNGFHNSPFEVKKICENNERGYLFITGRVNNMVVIDLDTAKGIWEIEGVNHPFITYFCNKFDITIDCYDWKFYLDLIITKIDTYTVKTPSGGFHLYFDISNFIQEEYETNLKNETNEEYNFKQKRLTTLDIDLQGDGVLVVGENTQVYRNREYVKYENYKDLNKFKDLDIKDWEYLSSFSKNNEYDTICDKSISKLHNDKKNKINWEFDNRFICDSEIELVETYFNSDLMKGYENFRMIGAFYKVVYGDNVNDWYKKNGRVDKIFQKYNDYCYENNKKIIKSEYPSLRLLDTIDLKYLKFKLQYKPTPENIIKPNITLEDKQFLSKALKLEPNQNYIIQSGTGTGKTYLMIEYKFGEWKQYPILSITSRVSLAGEHTRVFTKYQNNIVEKQTFIQYDKFEGEFYKELNSCNIMCCIDSIMRFTNEFDYSNYTVMLDEWNSILKYLYTSDTLQSKRELIKMRFKKILQECRQVIALDADINDNCFLYLNAEYYKHFDYSEEVIKKFQPYNPMVKNIQYIKNTRQHFKGVEVEELSSYEKLITRLYTLDKFMVCADSAKNCRDIKKKLVELGRNEGDIVVIDRLWSGKIDLDDYKCVIFSPKIIYGLDSQMERETFCVYMGGTISFEDYLQQIARNRNPIKVWLYFTQRQFGGNFYSLKTLIQELLLNNENSKEFLIEYKNEITNRINETILEKYNECDIEEKMKKQQDLYTSNGGNQIRLLEELNPNLTNFHLNIFARIIYYEDCGKSNKYLHLLRGLIKRGFNFIKNPINKTNEKIQDCNGKEDFITHFELAKIKYLDKEETKWEFYDQLYQEKNDILKLTLQETKQFASYFIQPMKVKQHLALSYLLFSEKTYSDKTLLNNLTVEMGFKISMEYLSIVNFIKNILSKIEATNDSLYGDKKLDKNDCKTIYSRITKILRLRVKEEIDLNNKYELGKLLHKMIKKITGCKNLYQSEQIRVGDKKYTIYKLDKSGIDYIENLDLYNIRTNRGKTEYLQVCLI